MYTFGASETVFSFNLVVSHTDIQMVALETSVPFAYLVHMVNNAVRVKERMSCHSPVRS
jgi:hypothetical protein